VIVITEALDHGDLGGLGLGFGGTEIQGMSWRSPRVITWDTCI
jgi:hypothetical protein